MDNVFVGWNFKGTLSMHYLCSMAHNQQTTDDHEALSIFTGVELD